MTHIIRPLPTFPKLIILDRDGVINHDSDNFIKTPDEWHPINGSLEAIARLNQMGIQVAVATNQGGVGRGILSQANLDLIHNKMCYALRQKGGWIDYLLYCNSASRDHPDYKPNPGMLIKICHYLKQDPIQTLVTFVGDKESDLIAAQSAYCVPILVKTGKGQKTAMQLQINLKNELKNNLKIPNKNTHIDFQKLAIYDNLSDYVKHVAQLYTHNNKCDIYSKQCSTKD